ncbi:GntR family transcriptional regulator [Salipiger bermudensis]|uniref:GntR family transcriptional regulator n=1 Tax=Salipiger bermudensis TaxID=344736 RepID=UPI001CD41B65|nr:GntR family transcriptional regulator [Salipiger bermudensis]MCA1287143.1 GntR family transcriptional regulator [Salipiger bermudensis]
MPDPAKPSVSRTGNLKPIASGSLSARAYEAMRRGLIEGEFAPGQRLVLQDLANHFGTSITPAREAAMRLASEGGLELRSGRFLFVPEMDRDRYLEVRAMRIELEGLAARVAATRCTPDALLPLREIQRAYVASDAPEQAETATRLNRQFHAGVYRLSGMALLISHIEQLWVAMGPMLTVFFAPDGQRYFGAEVHDAILDALEAGDGAEAERQIQTDIVNGTARFLAYFDRQEAAR